MEAVNRVEHRHGSEGLGRPTMLSQSLVSIRQHFPIPKWVISMVKPPGDRSRYGILRQAWHNSPRGEKS